MAKGKSLLSQTNSKSKQPDKYKETSESKFKYTYEVNQNIIYKGIIEEYHNTLATIIKRSHKNQNEYYTIKFSLDEVVKKDINGNILKSLADFDAELANEEVKYTKEKDVDQSDMSEIERKVIEAGQIPYRNARACLSPIVYSEMRCNECNYESRCIYHSKHNYKKLKF